MKSIAWTLIVTLWSLVPVDGAQSCGETLEACGDACYLRSKYTCYDGDFLCPVINGTPTLRCGPDCYLPSMYSCTNGHLVYPPTGSNGGGGSSSSGSAGTCSEAANQFHISQAPYDNYFYSDCNTAVQVVVTSPVQGSNLTVIGPRIVVAWPGGNSGLVVFFAPQNGVNGSLSIGLENQTATGALSPYYSTVSSSKYPQVGISGVVNINSTAVLNVAVLGSLRTVRDFTEGPSLLYAKIQNATSYSVSKNGTLTIDRLWLDNVTTTSLTFTPVGAGSISVSGNQSTFQPGSYDFSAYYNYPQLEQLSPKQVLAPSAQALITQHSDQTSSLSFFSYTSKLLAGGWRFLTYFGRDSMLTLLLMQPVLSEGQGGAIEAVIGSVLERINRTDGSACHEETIGDYATWLNEQKNITSTQPQCDYKMIDTDFYLPVLLQNYFLNTETGQGRSGAFFHTTASNDFGNGNLTYAQLALINAEKIMNNTAAFAQQGGQVKENLMHLKDGQIVGEWRDSTYGIGGGRIPFDVNTALVPAALRAISNLASKGYFTSYPDWNKTAAQYAQVWEDSTLQFFEVVVSQQEAISLATNYSNSLGIPADTANITGDWTYHGLALDGNNNQSLVKVMNTDDCFRHFLLNTTNQTQLTSFVSSTADHILANFPVGLSNPVGLLIANPAYGGDPVYAANWTNNAYQGTVVWSWQMAMMAAGLERQLYRCEAGGDQPQFCGNATVSGRVKQAYNKLWDLIDANRDQLSQEVWTWVYENGAYKLTQLGELPPPPGVGYTESDVRQLWSLTFLAVTRNSAFS